MGESEGHYPTQGNTFIPPNFQDTWILLLQAKHQPPGEVHRPRPSPRRQEAAEPGGETGTWLPARAAPPFALRKAPLPSRWPWASEACLLYDLPILQMRRLSPEPRGGGRGE